tara:strand:- start:1513 stop:1830 length:318 start_codon:yes stop_codon:yes gene_type:complete
MDSDALGVLITQIDTRLLDIQLDVSELRKDTVYLREANADLRSELTSTTTYTKVLSDQIRGNGEEGLASIKRKVNTLWFGAKTFVTILGAGSSVAGFAAIIIILI